MADRNENRRAYFRVNLNISMCGQLTILEVNGLKIDKGFTNICIKDIGVGGVRFKSKLDIPEDSNIKLGIKFKLYDKEHMIPASIVWKDSVHKIYGCEFNILENEKDYYIALFNKFSISAGKSSENNYKKCNKKRCELRKEEEFNKKY